MKDNYLYRCLRGINIYTCTDHLYTSFSAFLHAIHSVHTHHTLSPSSSSSSSSLNTKILTISCASFKEQLLRRHRSRHDLLTFGIGYTTARTEVHAYQPNPLSGQTANDAILLEF